MAAITDKITKTMDGQNPNTTFVSNERNQGSTELQARNLDGWPEDTAVHFSTYRVDAQGDIIDGTQTDWKGIVNRRTNTIVNLTQVGGAVDQGNSTGDVIEAMPTAAWANDLAEALLLTHTPDGSFKEKVMPYGALNPTTEYTEQSSVIDFNDAKFLQPGKWSFRDKSNVAKSTNRPCDNPGWLATTALNPSLIPGTQANGNIVQTYTDDTGVVYSRTIKSGQSATATYGKWGVTVPSLTAPGKDEQLTGQHWHDGRPIYRKYIVVNAHIQPAKAIIEHGIKDLTDSYAFVRAYGTAYLGVTNPNAGTYRASIPRLEGSHQMGVGGMDKTHVEMYGSYNWGMSRIELILEYVK